MQKIQPSELVSSLKKRWNGSIQASADPQAEGAALLLQAIASGRQKAIASLPHGYKDQARTLQAEAAQLLKTNGLPIQAAAHAQTVADYQTMELRAELEALRSCYPGLLQRNMLLIELIAKAEGRPH